MKSDTEWRVVRITQDENEQLQAIAPAYLKGGGKVEARVRWAIEQCVQALIAAEASPAAAPAESAPDMGGGPIATG
jgi:hypothetical protein